MWINFQELRARVSLEMVLSEYAKITTLTRNGDRLIGPCPIHQGDSPRAFHADLAKNVWFCFTKCHKGGNQLDFVAAFDRITIREAAIRLTTFFGLDQAKGQSRPQPVQPSATPTPRPEQPPRPTREPRPRTKEKTTMTSTPETAAPAQAQPVAKNPPLTLTLELEPKHLHLTSERGLSAETIEAFGVGYCKRGVLRGTIAIPIFDADGFLVAYAGRRLKPDQIEKLGKYVLPKGFRKELVLYHYDRAKHAMDAEGLILVESYFSVMKLFQLGFRNAVASMGSDVSEHQAELLAKAPEVIVLFDGDEAGRAGAARAQALLTGKTTLRMIRLPDGHKPDTISPRALRWLVNGARALDLAEVQFAFATT